MDQEKQSAVRGRTESLLVPRRVGGFVQQSDQFVQLVGDAPPVAARPRQFRRDTGKRRERPDTAIVDERDVLPCNVSAYRRRTTGATRQLGPIVGDPAL